MLSRPACKMAKAGHAGYMKFKLAFICFLGVSATNAMACYTVYDSFNRVIYNAQEAPVDMRRQLHETMPRTFPGGHMVFGSETDCPRTQLIRVVERSAMMGEATLVRPPKAYRN